MEIVKVEVRVMGGMWWWRRKDDGKRGLLRATRYNEVMRGRRGRCGRRRDVKADGGNTVTKEKGVET